MPYVKNSEYVDLPFSCETASGDFYVFSNLRDIATKCELSKEDVTRCRTIGILQSVHGKFFLSELDTKVRSSGPLVRLSVIYLKTHLPSTVIPYPVQVFGSMQWKNRPVIYAKLVQVLNTSIALRMNKTMDSVAKMHLAKNIPEDIRADTNDISLQLTL